MRLCFVLLFCSFVLLAPPAGAVTPYPLPTLYVYDLNYASSLPAVQRYDLRHAAACIQGLANRDVPHVFIKFNSRDDEWLTRLRESGGLCEGWPIQTVAGIDELLSRFRQRVNGVVLYDPDPNAGVISTSLAATTAAGCEGAVALRKDPTVGSLYWHWVLDPLGPQLPVLLDLSARFSGTGTIWGTNIPSTGSAKCDAYIWARQRYLDAGLCDPGTLSYTLDLWGLKLELNQETQLSNLDYAVSKRGFCFELSPWGDEKPNDDPNQPLGTDRATFRSILNSCNVRTGFSRMIKFVGFVNWPYKYTSRNGGQHGDVDTEWETARLITAYNAYKEADAASQQYISNASFYSALMPAVRDRRYVQNPAPTYADMQARGLINPNGTVPPGNYVMVGLGDYDQASWTLYWLAGERYDDAARGQATCNWGVNPNAVDRASVAMDYLYRHKSARDFFFAWDSGAGYINPTQLRGTRSPSGYASGVSIWQRHCREYYRLFDYSITAWLLNGSAGSLSSTDFRNYAPFSGDGLGGEGSPGSPTLYLNTPALKRYPSDAWPPPIIDNATGVNFAWYRSIIRWPNELKALEADWANSDHNHRFLDCFSFYYLLRHYLGGTNTYRATWVGDTIPRIMAAGQTYPVTVSVRNDGWDTWTAAGGYTLGHAIVAAGISPATSDYDASAHHPLPSSTTVAPGETVMFAFSITALAVNGTYDLYYDMVRENVTWFRQQNNIEWRQSLIVAAREDDVDTDGDGFPDVWETAHGRLWWHPGEGAFRFDFDADADVDQDDFGELQICFSEPAAPAIPPECLFADTNNDGLVDESDFDLFQRCMSGASVPIDVDCTN
jgi:hypothetical protein